MGLKERRQLLGLTQKQLADRLGTTQQTVARWESGKSEMNTSQLKNLSVLLQCSVEELLGKKFDAEDWANLPFAIADEGMPFGTLKLSTAAGKYEFPIDEPCRKAVEKALSILGDEPRSNGEQPWLRAWTLDNRILLVNLRHIRKLAVIGDDVEAMPWYAPAEVHRALEDWLDKQPEPGPLYDACLAEIERVGEEAALSASTDIRTIFADGEVESHFLDDDAATDLVWHVDHAMKPSDTTFLRVWSEGHYATHFVNLDHVAMIELPSSRYYRLITS